MRRSITVLLAVLIFASTASLHAQETSGAAAAPASATPAPRKLSPDRKAILALLGQLETAYGAGDAKAMAACWTEAGEFVGPSGARADGREAIAQGFTDAFPKRKGSKLAMHILSLRMVNDTVAMLDVVPEFKTGGEASAESAAPAHVSVMVLVKQDGHWLIESARAMAEQGPSQASHLRELEWLVGDWASENSKTGISMSTSCDWTVNNSFLIRKFSLQGQGATLHGGTEVIGWDPRTNRIRSWVFNSDGGFGENVWIRDGQRWIIKFSGTLANGNEMLATHVLTKIDAQTLSMESKDRFVNGERQDDLPAVIVKRKEAAKAADATKNSGAVGQ